MSIGIIDHLDESRIKELSKGFSSPEYLWDEIIDDYIYVLSNEHDIDANKTLYVDPFSRAPAGREVVERFNRLLIEYLPPSEAKYVAGMQRIHEKMAMGALF